MPWVSIFFVRQQYWHRSTSRRGYFLLSFQLSPAGCVKQAHQTRIPFGSYTTTGTFEGKASSGIKIWGIIQRSQFSLERTIIVAMKLQNRNNGILLIVRTRADKETGYRSEGHRIIFYPLSTFSKNTSSYKRITTL